MAFQCWLLIPSTSSLEEMFHYAWFADNPDQSHAHVGEHPDQHPTILVIVNLFSQCHHSSHNRHHIFQVKGRGYKGTRQCCSGLGYQNLVPQTTTEIWSIDLFRLSHFECYIYLKLSFFTLSFSTYVLQIMRSY